MNEVGLRNLIRDILGNSGYVFSHTRSGWDEHYYSDGEYDVIFDADNEEFSVFMKTSDGSSFVDVKQQLFGKEITKRNVEKCLESCAVSLCKRREVMGCEHADKCEIVDKLEAEIERLWAKRRVVLCMWCGEKVLDINPDGVNTGSLALLRQHTMECKDGPVFEIRADRDRLQEELNRLRDSSKGGE